MSKSKKKLWTDEFMEKFGLAYIKYEPLYCKEWKGNLSSEMKRQRSLCYAALAKELRLTSHNKSKSLNMQLARLCLIFETRYMKKLSQLYWSAQLKDETRVLDDAPEWMRTVEAKLQRLLDIKRQTTILKDLKQNKALFSENVARLAGKLATQLAKEAHAQRNVLADAFTCKNAYLLGNTLDDDTLKMLWDRMKQVSGGKLRVLLCAGDNPMEVCENARMDVHDWHVADALMLYSNMSVINKESHLLYEQLQPLIQVFHLVQAYDLEESDHPDPLAVRWTRAYQEYAAKGLSASVVLLQRRWCELKRWTRRSILLHWRDKDQKKSFPIHVAIAKRFPHVVTGRLPRWEELVRNEKVLLEPNNPDVRAGTSHRSADHLKNYQPTSGAYVETDDDLILIERDIETVELEDEDDEPEVEVPNDNTGNDESGDEKLVIDEPIVKQEDFHDNPSDPEDNVKVNVEKEDKSEISDISSGNAALVETTDNANKDDENNMEIDDTCIEAPIFVSATENQQKIRNNLNNSENNQERRLSNVEDAPPDNTVSGSPETNTQGDQQNFKVIDKETENISTSKDNTQTDETSNINISMKKIEENHDITLPVIKQETNEETNVQIELEVKPKVEGNDNLPSETNITCQETNGDSNYNQIVFKQVEIQMSQQIKAIDNEDDKAVIAKLKHLDPDKMQTEILFDSDSDEDATRGTSPVPGCSGLQNPDQSSIDGSKYLGDEETKKAILENIKDSINNFIPKVRLEHIAVDKVLDSSSLNNHNNEKTLVKVKFEFDNSECKEGVNPPNTDRTRFVFADDIDKKPESDASEDELSIAQIKRKKQMETFKNKIKFEFDDTLQEQPDDATELNPNGERTFGVSVVPLKDLNYMAQNRLCRILPKVPEVLNESDGDSEENDMSFAFGGKMKTVPTRFPRPKLWSVFKAITESFEGSCQESQDKVDQQDTEEANAKRVLKRVELPNIEEIRRINRNILTAQVTPITVAETTESKYPNGPDDEMNEEAVDSNFSDDDTELSIPSKEELSRFLDNLSSVSRITDRNVVQDGTSRGSYCCLARRHRAVNDARRRLAAKAGHAKPPPLLPMHGGLHLRECKCCCVHLVEELLRDDKVIKMQRALTQDVADLITGKPIDTKSWNNLQKVQEKNPPKKKAKKQKKDKIEETFKKDEKEDSKSGDADATSGQESQTSDDDTDDYEPDTSDNDELTNHTKSSGSSRVNSDDEDRRVTRNASRKKEKKEKDDANDTVATKKKDISESTEKVKADDFGYEEWIRQKNLASRFFEMGLPKSNADKKSDDKSKSNCEKDNQVTNPSKVEVTDQVEASRRNEVTSVAPEETVQKLNCSVSNQVNASENDTINNDDAFASVKITAISGNVIEINGENCPNYSSIPMAPISGNASGTVPADIQLQASTSQLKANLSGSFAKLRTMSGKVIKGIIVPNKNSLRGISSTIHGVTAGDRCPVVNTASIAGNISGVISPVVTGSDGIKVIADGQIATNTLGSNRLVAGNIMGKLIPVTVSNISPNKLMVVNQNVSTAGRKPLPPSPNKIVTTRKILPAPPSLLKTCNIASAPTLSKLLASSTAVSRSTTSTTVASRPGPLVVSKVEDGTRADSVVPPSSQIVRSAKRNAVSNEDDGEGEDFISKKLNAAMKVAEQKLRSMKSMKNLQLTIDLHNDTPTVSIAKSGIKRKIIDVPHFGVRKRTAPEMKSDANDVDDSDSDVVEVTPPPEPARAPESSRAAATPVNVISTKQNICNVNKNKRRPPMSYISVERFLVGKDPSTLQLMCVDEVFCNIGSHLFLTEVEYQVNNAAYLTIARWSCVEKVLFPVKNKGSVAADQLSHLLKSGVMPDKVTLGDKQYKMLHDDPLIYAQVFSMVVQAIDCRRLLMEGKPMWAYSKTKGGLHSIKMATVGPNNVGLMCDDNNAVKELVQRLNMVSKCSLNKKKEGSEPKVEQSGQTSARVQISDVIELDSDDETT